MRFLWPPLAILTCISAGWMMYRDSINANEGNEEKKKTKSVVSVEVTKLTKHDLVESIDLVGGLEASIDLQIHARGTGYLVKLPHDVHDAVKVGEVIAQLDDAEQKELVASAEAAFQVAKSKLKSQQTKLEQARTHFKRQKELGISGVATNQQLEEAQSLLEIAQAELEVQQAEVDQAEAKLHSSEMNLKRMRVTSPIDGFVAERYMSAGDLVNSTKPILRLVTFDKVKTVVNIVEKDYENIRNGQTAEIQTDVFPNRTFNGIITRISPVIDPRTRQAEVHIEIPNEDLSLKPGMHARVKIKSRISEGIDVLPVAALLEEDDNSSLYVVQGEPATTELREVTTGMTDGEFVEILEGVHPDDQVIVLGSRLVENEQEVQVSELKDFLHSQQETQSDAVAALEHPAKKSKKDSQAESDTQSAK